MRTNRRDTTLRVELNASTTVPAGQAMTTFPRVVIVGAGFGGLTAAKALKGEPFDVTVIDQHNYHLFQPLLYQVATAGLSPAEIASRRDRLADPRHIEPRAERQRDAGSGVRRRCWPARGVGRRPAHSL